MALRPQIALPRIGRLRPTLPVAATSCTARGPPPQFDVAEVCPYRECQTTRLNYANLLKVYPSLHKSVKGNCAKGSPYLSALRTPSTTTGP